MPGPWVSSSASRTSASARQELSSVSASRSDAIVRARFHSPAARQARGRGECPAAPLVGRVRRRQPRRLLEDRGRDRRGAAIAGQPRGVVEHLRDARVGLLLRERKMARARDRVLDDLRDPRVDAAALVAEVAVQKRGEQGMGKADGVALALDHVRLERGLEGVRGDPGLDEQGLASGAQRGDQAERVPGRLGQRRGARPHQLVERLGQRQRLRGVDVVRERARQLQREERVAPRLLVDPEQRLPRKRPPEPLVQEPVKRTCAQRADGQRLDALGRQRLLEARRLIPVDDTSREQDDDRSRFEPSQRELDRAGRRRVEPLDVVDRDGDRAGFADQLQHVAHRDRDGAGVDRIARGIVPQSGDLERAPPRRQELGQRLLENGFEQVAQPGVRERPLRLGRSRREDAQAPLARLLDCGEPERRLPDPRLAFQQERARRGPRLVEERGHGGELLLSGDDLECHLSRDRDRRHAICETVRA